MEFENTMLGTQAGHKVIEESEAQLRWAAKEPRRTKKVSDYTGRNEKNQVVKIQQRGQGAPAPEPNVSSEEQKQLMLRKGKKTVRAPA